MNEFPSVARVLALLPPPLPLPLPLPPLLLLLLPLLLAMMSPLSSNGSILDKYTARPNKVYHGRYTRNIHEPELLVPRRVFEDGSFNTYSLPNYYDTQELAVRRKRRSSEAAAAAAADAAAADAEPEVNDIDKLHLVLPFNGIEHHVELKPYHEFISPNMVIETRSVGMHDNPGEGLDFRRVSDNQCHYRGTVRGHANSKAALSLCDGVAGYVQTNHGRYFIEPVHEIEPEVNGEHVHMAYRKEAPHEIAEGTDLAPRRRCGTNDNWESAWTEQLVRRQQELMENNSPLSGEKREAPASSGTHSIHRYIELGLVADRRFLDFHNNTNYEQYLLTIMNMVSDFYHDSSAGNQIDVVLVRMIFLEKEKEEIDLLISPAAEDTLASFAKWAEKMNPKDENHPNHYDIAALITRHDICSEGTNCDLMGLAYVAAACDSGKAACINEDNGLLLGVVVAHEVGHVMGCSHDEKETSGCPPQDKDDSYFVMSPIVFIFTIRWSTCSRKFMTSFLESGLGDCLNDNPRNPPEKLKYPNMLPGAMYDGDWQCQMQFPGTKLCPRQKENACEALWCERNSSCVTKRIPMADGTKCAENKWCIKKNCVEMGDRPGAVHGGWGEWGPMSGCSRTCGGGVKYAQRECDSPPPANGGRYCLGERKRLATCNTTPCDPSKPGFRALQCAERDKEPILQDGLHQWKPYSAPDLEACALYCVNEQRTFVKISPTANDSTPCKPGTNHMCLFGTCRKVGCDWVIDSDAIEDKCGICKGDGTKCTPVEGVYSETSDRATYKKVVVIPKGARSIEITEEAPSKNTVAIRLEKEKTYCLNGNNREERTGEYPCAGSLILYTHPEKEKEAIEMKGPLSEDIQLEYAMFDPKSNPGLRYKYYVMSANTSYTPKYLWDFTEWSECSAKCGGGTMISEASCIEEQSGKVSPDFCKGTPRPEPKSRICNQEACPAKWRVSQWSRCNACDNKKGTRRRKVQCIKPAAKPGEDDVQANLDACKGRVPKQEEECVGKRPCKKTCPKATREVKRDVTESRARYELSDEDRAEIIDDLVDLSLIRYLKKRESEKKGDFVGARLKNSEDFEQLLRSWPALQSEEKETGNYTTPKPGSIIKDSVPQSSLVLIEAPFTDEMLQTNLSDRAYQQAGDTLGVSLDTSREKIYRGEEAAKRIEQLTNRNATKS